MNKKLTLLLLLSFHRFYAMEPDQSVGRLRRGEMQQTLDGLYDQIEQMQERGKAEVAAKLFLAKKLDKERMAHEETQLENARLQHVLEEQELRVEKIMSYLRKTGIATGVTGLAGLVYFLGKLLIH